jgi:hypothetical protein
MDSYEEMVQQIMDDEASYDDNIHENLAIITCHQKLIDDAEKKKKKKPCHVGRRESRHQQRLEGHTMLYNNYFSDTATHVYNFLRTIG